MTSIQDWTTVSPSHGVNLGTHLGTFGDLVYLAWFVRVAVQSLRAALSHA